MELILSLKKIKMLVVILFLFYSNTFCQITSGIVLLYPSNGQIIKEKYPSFMWTSGVSASSKYNIVLVEILENQTPESAIQSNLSYFQQNNLVVNTLTYPFEAPILEKGKKYAWQVFIEKTITFENTPSQTLSIPSEVFWFEYDSSHTNPICVAEVEENLNKAFYYLDNKILYFRFTEDVFINVNLCSYRFLDFNKTPINISRKIQPIPFGSYQKLSLRQFQYFRLKDNLGKIFYFEITSPQGISYFIRFINK